MAIIKFLKEKKEIQVPEGSNLRAEAMRAGVEIYSGVDRILHCPGLGCCGTCRVLITKGMENASPMGGWESMRLKVSMAYIGNEKTMRLSCQTLVNGDMEVHTTPPLNLFGENFYS
jgi:ferredoxin